MPAWVSSDATWDKAKKAARKQYPKLKGDRYWAIVAHIYKQMGGKVDKVEKSILVFRKAMPQGGSHPTHKYLRREGEPGHWHYVYEDTSEQAEQTVPQSMGQSEGGRSMKPAAQEQPETQSGSSGAPTSQGGGPAKLMLSTSILRDATPQDLSKPQIVLWTVATESGVESMRHTGKYVGTHASGGTHLSANRDAALQRGDMNPVLMALRVETASLKPIPPAKDVEESLFPDDPMGSQALYTNSVQGNSVVGLVRQGDPLWPEGEDDGEMSRVQDETNQNTG